MSMGEHAQAVGQHVVCVCVWEGTQVVGEQTETYRDKETETERKAPRRWASMSATRSHVASSRCCVIACHRRAGVSIGHAAPVHDAPGASWPACARRGQAGESESERARERERERERHLDGVSHPLRARVLDVPVYHHLYISLYIHIYLYLCIHIYLYIIFVMYVVFVCV